MIITFTACQNENYDGGFRRHFFLADSSDSAHRRALTFTAERATSRIVTTDEVLTENLTFFSIARERFRRKAADGVERLLTSSVVRVIPQSRESFRVGLQLYRARPDKSYSLTDCISMETMLREGLTEALTNDRHFEQEGFRALCRDS